MGNCGSHSCQCLSLSGEYRRSFNSRQLALMPLNFQNGSSVSFVLGALLCMLTARVLKRLINQERPLEAASWKKTEGMPSSHATNLTYYAARICLNFGLFSAQGVSTLLLWAVLLLWRIRYKYHTREQVLAGIALGSVLTVVWNAFVDISNLNSNLDVLLLFAKKTVFSI